MSNTTTTAMAAPMTEIQFAVDKMLRTVLDTLSIESKKLVVLRRNKDSKSDDFYVPKSHQVQIKSEVVTAIKSALLEESKYIAAPVRDVTTTDFTELSIFLHRTPIFKNAIRKVLQEQEEYGRAKQPGVLHKNIVLCCLGLAQQGREEERNTCVSVDVLRCYLLAHHMRLLLEAHGHNVTCVSMTDEIPQVFQQLGLKVAHCGKLPCDSSDVAATVLKARSHSCRCVLTPVTKHSDATLPADQTVWTDVASVSGKATSAETSSDTTETVDQTVASLDGDQSTRKNISKDCGIDLHKYITTNELPQGKQHFDTNLHFAEVTVHGRPSPLIEQVAAVGKYLNSMSDVICVHIVHERQAFSRQKLQLMLQALADPDSNNNQFQFVYGPVIARRACDAAPLNADRYYRSRYSQMKRASVMKYGDSVHGEGWNDVITGLTDACVKFELLSPVARNGVRVDLGEGEASCGDPGAPRGDMGAGAFVMYNCARLASLFSQFQQHVHAGVYPGLPAPADVDFSLLKEEEEWWLVYNYVSVYPDLVKQAVQPFNTTDTIHAQIYTHKICSFLSSLSRCVSSYYSRVHVLGENQPYLLPTMFARLYLLRSVHQVMVNGLALLGITAPTQL